MTDRSNSSSRRTWVALGALALAVGLGGYAFHLAWNNGGGTPDQAAGSTNRSTATPAKVEDIIASARTYVRQGESEKAETILAEASRQFSTDQSLRVAYVDILMAARKPGEAYEQYEKALAIGPREAKLEFTAGTAASMAGKPERALELYSAAQNADRTNPMYPLYLGQIQNKLGQNDEAKASLVRAAHLDPERAVTWGTLADIALRENNLDMALQHIARARTLEPGVVTWRLIESRALTRSNQPDKAVQLLVTLGEADRFSPPVLKQIGECYGLLSRPADAAAVYGAASDARPQDARLAGEAAEWARRANDRASALRLARRAASLGDQAGRELVAALESQPH